MGCPWRNGNNNYLQTNQEKQIVATPFIVELIKRILMEVAKVTQEKFQRVHLKDQS